MNRIKPLLSNKAILHRNYVEARRTTSAFVRSTSGDLVIALLAPTRGGKSSIFDRTMDMLEREVKDASRGAIPVVRAVVATANDGRISPRYVAFKLLRELRHPVYEHIGALDQLNHYWPRRGVDETTLRTAMDRALESRQTIAVGLDEAQCLVHTDDPEVRSRVLQSVKCLAGPGRLLFLAGGYELAVKGFFDSAHFPGRLVIVELPPYMNNAIDLRVWASILRSLEAYVPLSKPGLLVSHASALLHAANGSFGLLEKILYSAKVDAISRSVRVDWSLIESWFPPAKEHARIAEDIANGREALARLSESTEVRSASLSPRTKPKGVPFSRNPKRQATGAVKVANDV